MRANRRQNNDDTGNGPNGLTENARHENDGTGRTRNTVLQCVTVSLRNNSYWHHPFVTSVLQYH